MPWRAPARFSSILDEYDPVPAVPGLPAGAGGIDVRIARCPQCGAALVRRFVRADLADVDIVDGRFVRLADATFGLADRMRRPRLRFDAGSTRVELPVVIHCATRSCARLRVQVDEPPVDLRTSHQE